MFTRMYTAEIV